jgi:HD superfamily phosphohydrolase
MDRIYDSVHGFIHFNELECLLVDSLPFQRLHQIHQLGIAYLVYPGATHARFEHSLGVMELASHIFDRVIDLELLTDSDYWRQIVRLAALCHDLGHLPFSHVAEKVLLGAAGHEEWTLKIIQSPDLAHVWQAVEREFGRKGVVEDVIKLSIGEKKLRELKHPASFSAWEKALCQIITDDFFGADRIDYLLRDAQCTGVTYGLFDYHQLIEMLCMLPLNGGWSMGIEENGLESCEALLLARHFMHKRVYQYPSVKAYSFHLARFMKGLWSGKTLSQYIAWTDSEVLSAVNLAAKDPGHPGHRDARSLLVRQERFRAIPLLQETTEKEILSWGIPEREIGWELPRPKGEGRGVSFPVRKKSGQVIDGNLCSDIIVPSLSTGYIFVNPLFAEKIKR